VVGPADRTGIVMRNIAMNVIWQLPDCDTSRELESTLRRAATNNSTYHIELQPVHTRTLNIFAAHWICTKVIKLKHI